jgi:8-oxo-dGTP pyrophosphatase MutT (NUDIX family)
MNAENIIEFSVKALIIRDNKFLALHKARISSPRYELPGGRLLFGETVEEAVVREVLEETGLTVVPVRLVDTWNYVAENLQIVGVIYLCAEKEWAEIALSEEHDTYEWFAPEVDSLEKMNRLFKRQMLSWDWSALR